MILSEKAQNSVSSYIPDKKSIRTITDFFNMFADDTRLKLLLLLSISKMSVGDMSKILKMNQSTISHQLKILRAFSMVNYEKQGKLTIYSIVSGMESILEQGFNRLAS